MLKYLFFIGFIFSSSASASASASASDECDYTLPLGSIVACYENKNEESDAVLNKSYNDLKKLVMGSPYDDETKGVYWSNIVKSQKNWIQMRDSQCLAKGVFFENGTDLQRIEIKKCLFLSTEIRVLYLNEEILFIKNLP
ncbi:lysozyme inhibitor LprI family protein [Vibrio cholerae]|uniref:lysozyme inhibitor LprI family protein n=1 Tax=Vibrio cholerae TaxID=666 RepID=UPI000E0B9B25|nr:lysozyme inhibitor LprI family protein [Vibrio cholerae]